MHQIPRYLTSKAANVQRLIYFILSIRSSYSPFVWAFRDKLNRNRYNLYEAKCEMMCNSPSYMLIFTKIHVRVSIFVRWMKLNWIFFFIQCESARSNSSIFDGLCDKSYSLKIKCNIHILKEIHFVKKGFVSSFA